ncbi:helix-turn-helix domain-containing GNAT family N-acetyltransferase [Aestuariibius sp. 2305UL40-4]|uniref:helix-turn-helix domain-containing GNAT family N-acetyltransferase n=1 Tax=Aestuariibius violaceus TaxID=3234132 RepID=UPI00345F02E6
MPHDLVPAIRAASRQLVRELGFMDRALAGTDLPPSAVHALIEVGHSPGLTARQLSDLLLLEKSTISRLVRSLIDKSLVTEAAGDADKRQKQLCLTAEGTKVLSQIETFGDRQVHTALATGDAALAQDIETGLTAYASALHMARTGSMPLKATVREGYTPGLLARITELHACYYSASVGFGARFESIVAADMADFLPRLNHPDNATWHVDLNRRVMGGVSIDGQDLGPGTAHLRWFILDPSLHGAGLGQSLIDTAMAFLRDRGFKEAHLWTFDGLTTARALYERAGFCLAEEKRAANWGEEVLEQRFVWINDHT